jgi:DNA polymerase III epsilon subunit family exonuclease
MPDLLSALNPRQRDAVTHPAGPLLVLAGPGSGKTRVITHRAAFLVTHQLAPPGEILAVTFTNKAAEEMRSRLDRLLELPVAPAEGQASLPLPAGDPREMWVLTFHATALRLLREFGEDIGLSEHLVVWDEIAQRETLEEIVRELDLSSELFPAWKLGDWLTQSRADLRDPLHIDPDDSATLARARIVERYLDRLQAAHALDFDGLIVGAVQLLSQSKRARDVIQARFRHVLVDEFQDINRAQYQFFKLLAPPPHSDVLVVADDNQAIYEWRGARPVFIEFFRKDYRPKVVVLDRNYRSTQTILFAAQGMIYRDARRTQRPLQAEIRGGDPIYHYQFDTVGTEQAWIPRLIQRLVGERSYRYRDIAILYRTHRLGGPLEQALLQAGIPVQRIQKEPFFARPQVHEVIRYLRLLRGFTSEDVAIALNFPRTLVDELTMIQLRRLAADNQINLLEMCRRADTFPEISPLTRFRLRAFLRDLDEHLRPLASGQVGPIVEALFAVLERRRSPFAPADEPALRGFLAFLDPAGEATTLRRALDEGRPLIVVAPATVDGASAAAILQYALVEYLDCHPAIHLINVIEGETRRHGDAEIEQITASPRPPVPLSAGQVPVVLGQATLQAADLTSAEVQAAGGVIVEARVRGALRYSLSTLAWRLGQALLVSYEHLADGRFVVYDLETTGVDARRDDVVEIAAETVIGGKPAGEPFHTLVKPTRGFIPAAATKIHGITLADVQDAPTFQALLPRFLRYVEGAIVVGHNVIGFDNRFIDREMGRLLGRGFHNPSLDTLQLARRLLQQERYRLTDLVTNLGLPPAQGHRAGEDVSQTLALFFRLLEENRRQQELWALAEVLPLVAAGILAAEAPIEDENRALVEAGARVAQRSDTSGLWARLAQLAGPDQTWQVLTVEGQVRSTEPADPDSAWTTLREEFMRAVTEFQDFSPDHSLEAFLGYQALATSEDAYDPQVDKVTLMTLHNAKGLEFPVVIVIGVDHGIIPLWTATASEEESVAKTAEERRVFYVGMTRAKERLYLSSVRDRGERDRSPLRPPSQFALEIPEEYVRRVEINAQGQVSPAADSTP